jgi:hypothetical protein
VPKAQNPPKALKKARKEKEKRNNLVSVHNVGAQYLVPVMRKNNFISVHCKEGVEFFNFAPSCF